MADRRGEEARAAVAGVYEDAEVRARHRGGGEKPDGERGQEGGLHGFGNNDGCHAALFTRG